jgi:hypothetical protein
MVRHVTVNVNNTVFNYKSETVWEVSLGMQNYFDSRVHFLMAELFFGAKIITCHRFNTDGRLQHFVMLLQENCKKCKATQ